MHLLDGGQRVLDAAHVRPGRLVATTRASGCAPCSRPSVSRRRTGGTASPGPRPRPSGPASSAGDSHSTAPEMKSATTASMATPRPEMKIPVWPVARKSALSPRALISRSSASAVYFLPTEQSVPTVSSRLPGRLCPCRWRSGGGVAHVEELRPCRSAASRDLRLRAEADVQARSRRPSRPRAPRRSRAVQCSGSTPPALATPTISVLAPAAAASAMRHVGEAEIGLAARQAAAGRGTIRAASRRCPAPSWPRAGPARRRGTSGRAGRSASAVSMKSGPSPSMALP